jgi:hypothetical protein
LFSSIFENQKYIIAGLSNVENKKHESDRPELAEEAFGQVSSSGRLKQRPLGRRHQRGIGGKQQGFHEGHDPAKRKHFKHVIHRKEEDGEGG